MLICLLTPRFCQLNFTWCQFFELTRRHLCSIAWFFFLGSAVFPSGESFPIQAQNTSSGHSETDILHATVSRNSNEWVEPEDSTTQFNHEVVTGAPLMAEVFCSKGHRTGQCGRAVHHYSSGFHGDCRGWCLWRLAMSWWRRLQSECGPENWMANSPVMQNMSHLNKEAQPWLLLFDWATWPAVRTFLFFSSACTSYPITFLYRFLLFVGQKLQKTVLPRSLSEKNGLWPQKSGKQTECCPSLCLTCGQNLCWTFLLLRGV